MVAGAATFQSVSLLFTGGLRTRQGAVDLDASSTLFAEVAGEGNAELTAVSGLLLAPTRIRTPAAGLAAGSTLILSVRHVHVGTITLTITATLTVAAVIPGSTAPLVASATLTTAAARGRTAAVALVGVTLLYASGLRGRDAPDAPWVAASTRQPARRWWDGTALVSSTDELAWWDGDALLDVIVEGWWDGTELQPVEALGWYDGSFLRPFA